MLGKSKWLVAVGSLAVVMAGCGSSTSTPSTGQRLSGGTATMALPPSTTPNYIFPFDNGGDFTVTNTSQFQYLMWRPLYWFGKNGTVALNTSLSLANAPVYSNQNKTVTMTLKGWKWSNGKPITSRDVEFWMNIMKAEKTNWGGYVPGDFPDNVSSVSYPNPTTIVMNLNKAYNPTWFTYNELSQIIPIPQSAWDKTSLSGAIGNWDVTNPTAVYNFLNSQSTSLSTWGTNPLWQTVDGPWKLSSFNATSGEPVFVRNYSYSGPVTGSISKFIEVPFTSDSAQYNALLTGKLDYGALPVADLPQKAHVASLGFTYAPWLTWSITYFPYNFTNPTVGPIFDQTYMRQAMQTLINQPAMIKDIFKGTAIPDYGPVPIEPANSFADKTETQNPFPYSVSAATRLLTEHGWTVVPNGTSSCTKPGTGAGECGAGIAAGTKLNLTLEYSTGNSTIDQEVAYLKTTWSSVGINLALQPKPFNTVTADAAPCQAGHPCNWELADWGGGWVYSPDYLPTGEDLFATGAVANYGGYSNSTADQLITATNLSSSSSVFDQYENYLTTQLPVVWLPVADYALSEIKNTLHGVTPQDPLLNIYPENWYFTKG